MEPVTPARYRPQVWGFGVSNVPRRQAFHARYGRKSAESGSGHRLFYDEQNRLVDRYGRTLEKVRAGAAQAGKLAEYSELLAEAVESSVASGLIELGQVAGPKMIGRYTYDAGRLRAIAKRDNEIAELLQQCAEEDARAAEERDS